MLSQEPCSPHEQARGGRSRRRQRGRVPGLMGTSPVAIGSLVSAQKSSPSPTSFWLLAAQFLAAQLSTLCSPNPASPRSCGCAGRRKCRPLRLRRRYRTSRRGRPHRRKRNSPRCAIVQPRAPVLPSYPHVTTGHGEGVQFPKPTPQKSEPSRRRKALRHETGRTNHRRWRRPWSILRRWPKAKSWLPIPQLPNDVIPEVMKLADEVSPHGGRDDTQIYARA